MFLDEDLSPIFYSWEPHETEYYSARFKSKIEQYAVSCRRIDSDTAPIESYEYRMAIRAPNGHQYGGYKYYFHVIYQLSDGSWAGKNATANSKPLGWGNPSITPSMWDGDNYYPESCGTIYFAVRRW